MNNLGYKPFNVPYVILYVTSIKQLDDKYVIINSNKPVPILKNIKDWKLFIRHIELHIENNYSKYYSDSDNPRTPNINKNKLLEYINNDVATKINYNDDLFKKNK